MTGGSTTGAGSLSANLETLETFKRRVDLLLADLADSAASPHAMGEGALKASYFGTGFAEADSLYAAYTEVHDRLKQLSRTAADQIEAMSLLVRMAKNDYQNVDADEAARLWAIRRDTEKHFESAGQDRGTGAERAERGAPGQGSDVSSEM